MTEGKKLTAEQKAQIRKSMLRAADKHLAKARAIHLAYALKLINQEDFEANHPVSLTP